MIEKNNMYTVTCEAEFRVTKHYVISAATREEAELRVDTLWKEDIGNPKTVLELTESLDNLLFGDKVSIKSVEVLSHE